MKITKTRLKQIIKEELESVINEQSVSWWSSVAKFFPNVETAIKKGKFSAKSIQEDGPESAFKRFKGYIREMLSDLAVDRGANEPLPDNYDPTKETISDEEKILHDGFLKALKSEPVKAGVAFLIANKATYAEDIQTKREALSSLNKLLR